MFPLEIFIYDIVFEGYAAEVTQQIRSAGNRPIDLHINCPGGNVFDGYAIYNGLLAHIPGVTVYVDGLAGSIASYIAMAGKTIIMAENALFFLHNPNQLIGGNADDMRRAADLLDKCQASIIDAYVRRSKLSREKVTALLEAETWLTAEQAKEMGLADDITPALQMAAHFDMSKFRNAPQSLRNKLMNPFKTVITFLTTAVSGLTLTETSAPADVEAGVRLLAAERDGFRTQVANFAKSIVTAITAALPGKVTLTETSPLNEIEAGVNALAADRDSFRTQVSNFAKSIVAALTAALPGKITLTEASPLGEIENAFKLLVGDRDGLATQVTDLAAARDLAKKHVTLLEAYAKTYGLDVSGIDPKAALPAATAEGSGKTTVAEWDRKIKAARTPQARAQVCADFEKAVKEDKVGPADSITL